MSDASKVISDGIFDAAARLANSVLVCILLVLAFNLATGKFDKDDSDGEKRSGLRLHTDALTGCQYFSSSSGGVVPRMDANGRQVCKAPSRGNGIDAPREPQP